jgi:hypothetical protein
MFADYQQDRIVLSLFCGWQRTIYLYMPSLHLRIFYFSKTVTDGSWQWHDSRFSWKKSWNAKSYPLTCWVIHLEGPFYLMFYDPEPWHGYNSQRLSGCQESVIHGSTRLAYMILSHILPSSFLLFRVILWKKTITEHERYFKFVLSSYEIYIIWENEIREHD